MEPEFERMLARVGDAHREIVAAYHRAGGPAVLGSVAPLSND
jgi:hypothetical protein